MKGRKKGNGRKRKGKRSKGKWGGQSKEKVEANEMKTEKGEERKGKGKRREGKKQSEISLNALSVCFNWKTFTL